MSSLFIFPVNPVGATLAGIPLTTISKSYDWGGVFVALELASLFCCCLLIGARNVSRHMIDPSKFEWILYKNQKIKKIMVSTNQPLTFDLFTPGVKTWKFSSLIFKLVNYYSSPLYSWPLSTILTGISKWQMNISFSKFQYFYFKSHVSQSSLLWRAGWLNDVT